MSQEKENGTGGKRQKIKRESRKIQRQIKANVEIAGIVHYDFPINIY